MRNRRSALSVLLSTVAAVVCATPVAEAAGPRDGYVTSVVGSGVATFEAFTGVAGSPIGLAGRPWGVAITPDGATAYVTNEATNSVIPVDTATDTPGTPIPVGLAPRTIGIAPDGATAYVANLFSDTVTPIDTAAGTPGSPIPVGSGPHGIAIAPDGSTVYVSNIYSATVSVIDTQAGDITATIPVDNAPYTIAITPDGATVYVTHLGSAAVTPIDTTTNTAGSGIPVGNATYGVAVSPDGATAYVSVSSDHNVVPIDTATNTAGTPIPVGTLPEGLAITPDGSTAYVTDVGNDTVRSLDLATGVAGTPMPTAQAPMTIAIDPNQGPEASFGAAVDDMAATFDASAASDPDGTVANYAWDFGDGHTATGSDPVVGHDYEQPGEYAVTLTVTDDEGCSDDFVFTGQTASCNGTPDARVTNTVVVDEEPVDPPASGPETGPGPEPEPTPTSAGSEPGPMAAGSPGLAPAAPHQAIERFALDGKCVRRARDGRARIGLRLRLALPGAVAIEVHRAVAAKGAWRCPYPGRYRGELRRVVALENVTPETVSASVRRRLTRRLELPPGLYRIAVRAHGPDGTLSHAAHRWVRVLAEWR